MANSYFPPIGLSTLGILQVVAIHLSNYFYDSSYRVIPYELTPPYRAYLPRQFRSHGIIYYAGVDWVSPSFNELLYFKYLSILKLLNLSNVPLFQWSNVTNYPTKNFASGSCNFLFHLFIYFNILYILFTGSISFTALSKIIPLLPIPTPVFLFKDSLPFNF